MSVGRIFSGLVLNGVLCVCSYLVPKRRNTFLLGGGLGKSFSGNPKYFYLYLERELSKGRKVWSSHSWITKSDEVLSELQQANRPVIDARTFAGFWAILRSEFLILESGTAIGSGAHDIVYERILLGRFKIVQMWHGSPLKRINLDALHDRENPRLIERIYTKICQLELSRLTVILALSEADASIFRSAFNNNRIVKLGYPKNDVLFGDPQSWGVTLRYQKYDKVLLYAPTFRDHPDVVTPFTLEFLERLDGELRERNWCLLIKKHPYDRGLHVPRYLENILDVTTFENDIQELLVQTDLLITDYSSVFVDFLLRDKPQIFYVYDLDDYKTRSRGMYYELKDMAPGPIARTEEELLDLMLTADEWYLMKTNRVLRAAALERFHSYTAGGACKRVAEALTDGFREFDC